MQAVFKTYGPILEIGTGLFSTPALHTVCTAERRPLVSLETDQEWYTWACQFDNPYHTIHLADRWTSLPPGGPWDVIFVDTPADPDRIATIAPLVEQAAYIVVHSSDDLSDVRKFDRLDNLFHYRLVSTAFFPSTGVFSNKVMLDDFWQRTMPRTIHLEPFNG